MVRTNMPRRRGEATYTSFPSTLTIGSELRILCGGRTYLRFDATSTSTSIALVSDAALVLTRELSPDRVPRGARLLVFIWADGLLKASWHRALGTTHIASFNASNRTALAAGLRPEPSGLSRLPGVLPLLVEITALELTALTDALALTADVLSLGCWRRVATCFCCPTPPHCCWQSGYEIIAYACVIIMKIYVEERLPRIKGRTRPHSKYHSKGNTAVCNNEAIWYQ